MFRYPIHSKRLSRLSTCMYQFFGGMSKVTFYIKKKTFLVTLISNLTEILFLQSFLRSIIFKINDIWDKNNKTFVDNQNI